MKGRKRRAKRPPAGSSVRASISFPAEAYNSLDEIAKQKKVSLAWVVREAVEKYLAEKWPLFGKQE
jgi:predicted DNA-binding protein